VPLPQRSMQHGIVRKDSGQVQGAIQDNRIVRGRQLSPADELRRTSNRTIVNSERVAPDAPHATSWPEEAERIQ